MTTITIDSRSIALSPAMSDERIVLEYSDFEEEVFSPHKRGSHAKKRVTFDELVKYDAGEYYITPEEQADVWYSQGELKEITKECRKLVHFARKIGQETPYGKICLRGLESAISRRAGIEERVRKVSVRQAVLIEQRIQDTKNLYDPSRIRRRSLMASKPSKQLASQLAWEDAMEVRRLRSCGSQLKRSRSCLERRSKMEDLHIDHSTRTIVV